MASSKSNEIRSSLADSPSEFAEYDWEVSEMRRIEADEQDPLSMKTLLTDEEIAIQSVLRV